MSFVTLETKGSIGVLTMNRPEALNAPNEQVLRDLAAALESLREEILLARDLRSMEHANNAYKALHDLDYFLLRYGPADVGPYVTDDSTVSTYYGTLSVYA